MFKRNENDRNAVESRSNIFNGAAMIAIAFILAVALITSGCSGGNKRNPTDPIGGKNKAKQGDLPGSTSQTNGRSGVNSGPGSGASIPLQTLLDQLVQVGGGQGGRALPGDLNVGVFDAVTLAPIEGAVVSVGNDGLTSAETDSEGLATFTNVHTVAPSLTGDELQSETPKDYYVTAGVDGYEMASYNYLDHQVVVFLLNPLVAPVIPSAEIHGTVDFGTSDFLGNVYITHPIDYADGILTPSGPGVETDDYSITCEPLTDCTFLMIQRSPRNGLIIRLYSQSVTSPAAGESMDLDLTVPTSFPPGNLGGGNPSGSLWLPYPGNQKTSFPISLPVGVEISDLASCGIYQYVTNMDSFLPVIDFATQRTLPYPPNTISLTTTCAADIARFMSFNNYQVWTDAKFNDGSGSLQPISMNNCAVNGEGVSTLYLPPRILSPEDDALGVGLTPQFGWTNNSNLDVFYCVLTLTDTVNSNRWIINVNPGSNLTKLPVLPIDMQSWGLTLSNSFDTAIVKDLSKIMAAGPNGIPARVKFPEGLKPSCYSKEYTYTP